jgi:phage protein D
MTDIEIPFGDNNKDNAVLLLAAAQELELEASVVRTTYSAFIVPEEVAKKAKVKGEEVDEADVVDTNAEVSEPEKAPAKKAAAKKSTAKRK